MFVCFDFITSSSTRHTDTQKWSKALNFGVSNSVILCFSLHISATFFYQIWLTLSAFSFRSDLFNISCWKDANFAPTLAEPPVVLLLVVDVDHVAVADAQLVVHVCDVVIDGSTLTNHSNLFLLIIDLLNLVVSTCAQAHTLLLVPSLLLLSLVLPRALSPLCVIVATLKVVKITVRSIHLVS